MKLAAFLLIVVSMCVGVVGAITAYLPPLSLPDHRLVGLTLNDPAGNTSADVRAAAPIARKNDVLTPELLATLRGAGVERVRVKEFSFARWPEWWVFVLGCVGLGAAAFLVKTANRRALAAKPTDGTAGGAAAVSPERAVEAIGAELDALRERLSQTTGAEQRLEMILRSIEGLQQTHVAAFIAARPQLVARLGLGGYARLMDSFASAERAMNRAWSAAADDVESESRVCLDRAAALIAEAKVRL